jgi:mRNA deadenylase 3'-5' endonuclease subunit Ccr4
VLLQAQSHQLELYRGSHPNYLYWPRRWAMIRQELADLSPDIICLQASCTNDIQHF